MSRDKNFWWLYLIIGLGMNLMLTGGLALMGATIMALALHTFLANSMPKTFEGLKIVLVVVALGVYNVLIGLLSGDIGAQ